MVWFLHSWCFIWYLYWSDLVMSDFDEIWNDGGALSSCSRDEAEDFYNEGQQSQQAKIDELKMSNHHLSVQLVDSNAHYDHVKKERDELQARVDGALKSADINFWNSSTVKDMVDILKGNKDEN